MFGSENIKFIVYEDLRSDPIKFSNEISEILSVDKSEMARIFENASKVKGEKSRISLPAAEYFRNNSLVKSGDMKSLASFLNKHLEIYGKAEDKEVFVPRIQSLLANKDTTIADRRELFMSIYRQTEQQIPDSPRATTQLTPHLSKLLRNRIGKQLRWVQNTYGIDLASRGYDF